MNITINKLTLLLFSIFDIQKYEKVNLEDNL